jgi:hypothetical protein
MLFEVTDALRELASNQVGIGAALPSVGLQPFPTPLSLSHAVAIGRIRSVRHIMGLVSTEMLQYPLPPDAQ